MWTDRSSLYSRIRMGLQWIFGQLDRLFNAIFTSEFNPLYRSGTIAVALLSLATVTGLILIFFYRLGEAYESIVDIQNQIYFGRWLRAVHRYSSDAAVYAVVIHIFRMFVQKKSWGPRILAWLSGVILLLSLLITGWTGFVMVWDTHAQVLAMAGAKVIDSLGFLPDPISRSFNGEVSQPPSSFFFLNLFLHIVLPLGMIFGVWVHTAKMARATWFPHRRLYLSLALLLGVGGALWPAPLDVKADLLSIPQHFQLSGPFGFWLMWAFKNPVSVALGFFGMTVFLFILPGILRPSVKRRPPSSDLDPAKCHGCTQCVVDCPYEAIQMVPRKTEPWISEQIASVDPDLCVSCGLCAASCGPMTIGPLGRKGTDQYQTAKRFVSGLQEAGLDLSQEKVIVGCLNQPSVLSRLEKITALRGQSRVYPVACMGTLHMGTIGYLAVYFKDVILAACPERNCTNKDAFMLLRDRLSGKREPGLPGRVESSRVHLLSVGDGEEGRIRPFLQSSSVRAPGYWRNALSILGGVGVFLLIAMGSQVNVTANEGGESRLRLSWRLAGQNIQDCRSLTEAELKNRPIHMRKLEDCVQRALPYQLSLSVDGTVYASDRVLPGGFRSDGPLYVDREIVLRPGTHEVKVRFVPEDETITEVARFDWQEIVHLNSGDIGLIYLSPDQSALQYKTRTGPHTDSDRMEEGK